jgi:penicillin amidase
MKPALRILLWALAVLVAVVLVVAGGGYLWLRRSLPQTSGTVRVQGLAAPVAIVRDANGIPHISGQSEADALFGLGYVHAQDRLWQMEYQRRVGNGRLAEVLGPAALQADRFLRTLGTGRAAQSAYDALDPETRGLLDAYAAGVNAFVDAHRGSLPPEFTILGIEPEPWRPQDSLAWVKMMSWDLGGNWEEELTRVILRSQVGPEAAEQLLPAAAADDPIILPDGGDTVTGAAAVRPAAAAPVAVDAVAGEQLARIGGELELALGLGSEHVGSNNWVVAGSRTASGKPILANDPHLGSQMPALWYLAHISGGAIDAAGATLPGLPGVVIGHNGRIAWGVTNTDPDVQDLFVERVNARNEALYQERWEPLTIIPETIKVKGEDDVELFVRVGRHGPLISDVTAGTGDPLAFRWTALDPEDGTMRAFLGVNRAQNWDEFTAALSSYHAPMQNFVYADVDGNIGYYAPGAVPIRTSGDGRAPAEGWTGQSDWAGYIPFAELPHDFNPERGYIATANNRQIPDAYPYLISTNWAAPYRAQRIVEQIEAQPRHTLDTMAALQADVVSLQARDLLPAMTSISPADERERAAVALLRDWDGTMAGDSAAAAVYAAYYHALPEAIFGDELRGAYEDEYTGNANHHAIVLEQVLRGDLSAWCDDVNTPDPEGCDVALGTALTAGLATMSEAQGTPDIAKWRWDTAHVVIFPHNPFDNVGALKPIFSRSIPNGGDTFTVNVGPVRRSELYHQHHVPSYRQLIDLADLGASRFVHTTGQSGNPLSGMYDNWMARWQRVEYVPIPFGGTVTGDTLTLTP